MEESRLIRSLLVLFFSFVLGSCTVTISTGSTESADTSYPAGTIDYRYVYVVPPLPLPPPPIMTDPDMSDEDLKVFGGDVFEYREMLSRYLYAMEDQQGVKLYPEFSPECVHRKFSMPEVPEPPPKPPAPTDEMIERDTDGTLMLSYARDIHQWVEDGTAYHFEVLAIFKQAVADHNAGCKKVEGPH